MSVRAPGDPTPQLGVPRQVGYALGDVSLNTGLVALALVYAGYFLPQIAEIRPVYAGLIPLLGRIVDAFSDPLMGWLSDRTRTRFGRRRPFFLLGAIPYGLLFAMLWSEAPVEGDTARFAYYAAIYCLFSLAMTVPSVPYLSVLPEMAEDYDQRTTLNTYRAVGSIVGAVFALSLRPLAEALGGGAGGFARAGWWVGIALIPIWFVVFFATFERFGARPSAAPLWGSAREAFSRRNFRRLIGLYLFGRIAMDLASTMLLLFYTYWLFRADLFEPVMGCFFAFVIVGYLIWRRVAERRDKAQVFILGSIWWMLVSFSLLLAQPSWPWPLYFMITPLFAIGFAVVDLMPWSMIGEVIDEAELERGERREGIYNGIFTFVRKLGGALGIAVALAVLDAFGYEKVANPADLEESARQAIRWMTAMGPIVFIAIGILFARGYPLTRARHTEILDDLASAAAEAAARAAEAKPPRSSNRDENAPAPSP